MELVNYLNSISPAPTYTAGVAPDGDDLVVIAAASTSVALKALLDDVTPVVRPLVALENDALPYIVYGLDDARLQTAGAASIGTQVSYDVGLFNDSASDLAAMIDTTNDTLTGCEIVSLTTGYEPQSRTFQAFLRVQFFKPAISDDYPLVLVSQDSENASENIYDNRVGHQVRRNFTCTIISNSDNIETLRSELRGHLLGYQQTAEHEAMMYASGSSLPLAGGLYAWQEQYYDFIHYRES